MKPTPPYRSGNDPRSDLDLSELEAASLAAMPQIQRTSKTSDNIGLALGIIGAASIGALTLLALNHDQKPNQGTDGASSSASSPAFEPEIVASLDPPQPIMIPSPEPLIIQPQPPKPVATPVPIAASGSLTPAMIIDNSSPVTVSNATTSSASAEVGLVGSVEQFAKRLSGDNVAVASHMANPSMTVPEGAIISAVLETALNSDLPGYARAIVSRDVKSFDGKRVVIPRASRLIGQYKSGLSSGVTRAFIIWTRLIRPDGSSVNLGSPTTDELGQAGLSGRVDTHFGKRFGAAFLLSIVNGLSSSAGGGSNTIVIGTATGAQSAVSDALNADAKIPPTIKVAQGTAIQVFVVHDLNFGG